MSHTNIIEKHLNNLYLPYRLYSLLWVFGSEIPWVTIAIIGSMREIKGTGVNMSRSVTYLAHYGIKGMRPGVRRYQNKDGTLTAAGRNRYGKNARSGGGGSSDEGSHESSTPEERVVNWIGNSNPAFRMANRFVNYGRRMERENAYAHRQEAYVDENGETYYNRDTRGRIYPMTVEEYNEYVNSSDELPHSTMTGSSAQRMGGSQRRRTNENRASEYTRNVSNVRVTRSPSYDPSDYYRSGATRSGMSRSSEEKTVQKKSTKPGYNPSSYYAKKQSETDSRRSRLSESARESAARAQKRRNVDNQRGISEANAIKSQKRRDVEERSKTRRAENERAERAKRHQYEERQRVNNRRKAKGRTK